MDKGVQLMRWLDIITDFLFGVLVIPASVLFFLMWYELRKIREALCERAQQEKEMHHVR